MTTMEPHFADFELPNFVFLNNKPKRGFAGVKNFDYMPFPKSHGPHYNNGVKSFGQFPVLHKNNGKQQNNRNSINKNESLYNMNKFANGAGPKKDNKNWIAYASTASDSDSSHVSSELSGFKIVQQGKTIHNETDEDYDSATDFYFNGPVKIDDVKYASSTLTMVPSAKEISLPSFA